MYINNYKKYLTVIIYFSLIMFFYETNLIYASETKYQRSIEAFKHKDYELAKKLWLELSDENNNVKAQNNLGFLYNLGMGVEQDYKKSAKWFNKAAAQGNVAAQFNLGQLYEHGYGVEQDHKKAVFWSTKAALQGDNGAFSFFGSSYLFGTAGEQNYEKAIFWYNKAVDAGDFKSNYMLARIYYDGFKDEYANNEENIKPKIDYVKAMSFFRKAADHEDEISQLFIAEMYEKAEGVKQDINKAIH